MGFFDFIKSLIGNNKLNARLITHDFSKTVGGVEALEIALYDGNTPLTDKNINIKINGVFYSRKTNSDGIARLNINLPVGIYDAHAFFEDETYNYTNSYCKVTVNPVINTSDLNMNMGDGSRFTAKLTDKNNNPLGNVSLIFNINGKSYTRTTNNDGEASLNINLNTGTYTIQTKVNDIIVENKIHINPVVDSQHFGYWIFGKDMLNVNIQQLKDAGVTDIFLNYYAIESHGEEKVKEFIANAKPINTHIWMQCFYDGEWHNPVNTDLSNRIEEAKKYANINGVAGIHLDYLRYPGNAYKTSGGAEAITQFVRNVRESIPKNTILSCAVMPENQTKYYYGQDIEALGQILDVIIPMQYKGNYNAGTSWLASTTKSFSQQSNIWSGLQSYKSDDDTTLLSSEELGTDIKTCLDNGAKGAVLFRYGLSNNVDFKQYQKQSTGKQDTRMEGTNINMTYQDGTQYQCAVYDPQNKRVKDTVKLTINGVTYTRNSDNEGLYKLNINLNPGTYDLKAVFDGNTLYNGSSILNSIVINPAPTPTPTPTKLYPYITEQGGGKLGQRTGYSCGPHSLMQCIYRLTGIELSETELMSVCGTTTSGTGHDGLETGLAWFNRKYGYNLKMTWKNKSELTWDEIQWFMDNAALFFHLLYRDQWGHYEVAENTNLKVLNSLGDSCGNGYCGYIENRSRSTQQSYINGISQKSVCIITHG